MPGTITLRPIEANLTHNTDILTKMNPYCSIIVGVSKFNSQICKKGGKHPHWNDSITVPFQNESTMILELMDKDRITKDDIIGGCSINITELQSGGSRWYPLFYKNKPAGEILLEASFEGEGCFSTGTAGMASTECMTGMQSTEILREQELLAGQTGCIEERTDILIDQAPTRVFSEQRQVVEPHTFVKNVDVVETVPVLKEIEVTEPIKVLKEVEYTEAVPVRKQIEVVEPLVVTKEVEVIEPRVVTKTIQVVENIPVMKQVEVVEMVHGTKEVETLEPQTFTKQVEVTENVPVKKLVQVTEPVTVTKAVEFVEPIITTQTITKELQQPVIVDERITTSVGPATLVGVCETEVRRTQEQVWNQASGFTMQQTNLNQGYGQQTVTKDVIVEQPAVITTEQTAYKEQKRDGFFLDH